MEERGEERQAWGGKLGQGPRACPGDLPADGHRTSGWAQVSRHLTPQGSLSPPSPGDLGKEGLRLTGRGREVMLRDKS